MVTYLLVLTCFVGFIVASGIWLLFWFILGCALLAVVLICLIFLFVYGCFVWIACGLVFVVCFLLVCDSLCPRWWFVVYGLGCLIVCWVVDCGGLGGGCLW